MSKFNYFFSKARSTIVEAFVLWFHGPGPHPCCLHCSRNLGPGLNPQSWIHIIYAKAVWGLLEWQQERPDTNMSSIARWWSIKA